MRKSRKVTLLGVLTVSLLSLVAVAWAGSAHKKGTLFKGTMKSDSGQTCTAAVFKLDGTERPVGRMGIAKGCGWMYNFFEYGYPNGKNKYCNVSETANSITFSCNYRAKGIRMIGSFTGKVCNDC